MFGGYTPTVAQGSLLILFMSPCFADYLNPRLPYTGNVLSPVCYLSYTMLLISLFFSFGLGSNLVVCRLTSDLVFRDYSWWDRLLRCWELNPRQLLARKAPYCLYCLWALTLLLVFPRCVVGQYQLILSFVSNNRFL